jgi:hypothetical protein
MRKNSKIKILRRTEFVRIGRLESSNLKGFTGYKVRCAITPEMAESFPRFGLVDNLLIIKGLVGGRRDVWLISLLPSEQTYGVCPKREIVSRVEQRTYSIVKGG